MSLEIKKKDRVIVLTGEDKGKTEEVLAVFPKKRRVIVRKINLAKRHTRGTQNSPGGILEKENSIHVSNVMLVCPKCNQPTRVKISRLQEGKKVRVCKKCGEIIL